MSYNKKAIADALSKMNKARKPKQVNDIIMDPEGQNKFPGLPTRIPSNNITMETTPYPVLGVDNFGNQQMMYPGANYTFPGADYVDEYPMMQIGGQRPILYVDPNDPAGVERYTAYNDSLDKFNKGNKNYLTWINYGAAGGRGPFWRRVIESALPDDYVIPDQVNQPIGQKVTEATFPIALIVGSRRPFGKEYYKKTVDLYAEPKQPVFYKDSKEHIQDKQQQLIDAGYDIGKADGIWGPKSQAAWEEFQKTQTTEPEVTPQPTPEQAPTLEVAPLDNTPQRPVQTQTPPQAAQVPSGYNVWTHNGQPLDPAVYGWAPSNSPRQISQFADTHSLKRANEAYNKLGATPWATTGNKLVTDLYKPYFSKQAATNAIEQTAQQLGVPVEQLQIVKAPAGYSGYVVIQNLPQQKYGGLVTGLTNTSGNLLMNEQGKRMMAKSGSLYATNKLFLGNPLVTKRKKAVFVPGHDFQTGGEQTESTIENPSTVLPRSTINEYYNFRRANLIDLSLTPEQAREKYTSVNPVLFDAYTFFKNKGWTPVDSSTYHDEDFRYCSSKGCFYDDNSWNTFISANSPAETPIVERPLVTPETSNVQTPEQPPILPVIPLENVPQQVVTPQQPVPTQTPPQQPVQTNQPQVTPAPQQPSETPKSSEPKPKYHKEYNPYTGKNEPMSPKQKIELDRLYSRDLPMPENWQPELIETYRRQSGGATDWKSRIASAMNFQKGGQLSKEEFEKRKAAYKKMTGRDFEPPKSFKQSPQARKYYQNKYNQQPVIQSQPSETVQQSRGMSADEAEQLKIQNAPLDPRINQFSFEADNRSEEQRQRDQEAASQLTDPTGWNQVANYLQAPLFQAGNFWDYVSGGDDWEKAQQAYNLNQLNPYSQNKMFNFLNTGLSNTGNALMTGMEIADGYAIARALPGFGRQVGKTLSPQIKKQTPSLPDNVIPPQIHQAGLINMKGAFQKYPKGKLTKEELEAYMNSDFYKESLKRHREAKKAYGDKWDLDPLAKEYLRENFLTGNRTGINSVLYGGDNWSWPNYFMAGVIGGAMPSVAGLYGLALAPPAVRSKVMRSIGIQGVPGGLEAKDTTIDITNKNMDFARVNEIKDGTVIIGGEFIESSNNTVRKAKDWLRAEDTYSDKNYPSDKIESFYGVEDGKFKVGKAKDFKSETQLVPRRFGAKNISKAVLNGVEMRLLDNKGQPIYQNTPNTGKFILYSPSTKKAAFIYITNGKRGVEEVNKFLKENKDAQYIHLDNGRYEFYGVNEQGLTQQDFKNYYEQDLNRKGNPGYNLIIKKTGGTFFQQGGTTEEELTPAQLAMMKARLAYAHMHGNPSAQRMVAPVDNPYIFTGTEPYASPDTAGYSGTHYMFSQGPFAVPTIQTGPDGQLYYNVNASPNDSEAMQFDSPEDAEVFARYYKTVAPAFQDMELTDEEIEEYKRGGCTIVKL
jgi:hypothetical protein